MKVQLKSLKNILLVLGSALTYDSTQCVTKWQAKKRNKDIRLLWLSFHQIVIWVWIYLCLSMVTWWNLVLPLNFEKPENFSLSAESANYWCCMYPVKTFSTGLFFFCFLVVEDLQSNFFTSGNMVPICLCSSHFCRHGKIFFQFFWSILSRQLITLLCIAVFSNLTPGSRVEISLNECKKCF